MKHKMFVVYDSKVEGYTQPFTAPATGAAIRNFADEANGRREGSPVKEHPGDFTLFEIGTYDDQAGVCEMYEAKKSLGTGLDYLREPQAAAIAAVR